MRAIFSIGETLFCRRENKALSSRRQARVIGDNSALSSGGLRSVVTTMSASPLADPLVALTLIVENK